MIPATTFPFQITALPVATEGALAATPRFCIEPDPGDNATLYRTLFQAFGFSGSGASWSEHIQAIVEEEEPELFDHLDFTLDQAGRCRIYADGPATARFTALLCPRFADLHQLRRHLSLLDPTDFFE